MLGDAVDLVARGIAERALRRTHRPRPAALLVAFALVAQPPLDGGEAVAGKVALGARRIRHGDDIGDTAIQADPLLGIRLHRLDPTREGDMQFVAPAAFGGERDQLGGARRPVVEILPGVAREGERHAQADAARHRAL